MLTAIIVAAGDSRRMGFDKLLAPIARKPVIAHTIRAFEQAKSVPQ
jgi:CTP:molybdopterin cytidylyltransferase MocA